MSDTPAVQLFVFGPMRIERAGTTQDLGTGARGAVLARLATAGRHGVSTDQLAEDVWDGRASALGTARVTIRRLRVLLGEDAIVRGGRGYVLDRTVVGLDADRFEQLLASARSGAPTRRLLAIEEALALVRGEPYDGLHGYPFAATEAARLRSIHAHALDERFALLVEMGAGTEIVSELEAAVRAEPLRERRCAALMVALYRSGRQADALAALRRLERQLRQELGLSPGPELRRIERLVLAHDAELLTASRTPADGADADIEVNASAAMALARMGIWSRAARAIAAAVEQARAGPDPSVLGRVLVQRARITLMSAEHDPTADTAGARADLDEAAGIARRGRDGVLLAATALARFGNGLGADPASLLVALAEPLDHLPRRARERVDLLSAAAVTATFSDDEGATADRLLGQIRLITSDIDDPRVHALQAVVDCIVRSRHPDTALDQLADRMRGAVAAARACDDPTLITAAMHVAVLVAGLRGDLAELERLAPALAELGHESMLPFAVQRARLLRHACAIARGDLGDELQAQLDETATIGMRLGDVATVAVFAQRTFLTWELARYDEVVAVLGQMVGDGTRLGLAEICLELALAESGPASYAVARADALAGPLAALPREGVEGLVPAMAAELAWLTGSASLAAAARAHLDTEGDRFVVLGLGTLVFGPRDVFVGLCCEASGDHTGAIEHLGAGLAALERRGAGLAAARARMQLAVSLTRRAGAGDRRRAAELCRVPGAVISPRLAHVTASVAGREEKT